MVPAAKEARVAAVEPAAVAIVAAVTAVAPPVVAEANLRH